MTLVIDQQTDFKFFNYYYYFQETLESKVKLTSPLKI